MFTKHMMGFAETLTGLRSFVDLVAPFLQSTRDKASKRHAKDLVPLALAFAKLDPVLFGNEGFSETDVRGCFDGQIKIGRPKKTDEGGKRVSIEVSGPQEKSFQQAMDKMRQMSGQIALLYQNALISLISAVECFLSQIIYGYFDTVPTASSDKEKVFSLDDLRNFDSVEDARIYILEKRVTDLMRGSFSDWIEFFKSKPKLTMSYLDPYMGKLVETCERRNLLIHNAGIVNTIYLSKVTKDLRRGIKKGDKIELTRKYLDERIDYFETYSLLIAAELWKQLKPNAENRANVLGAIAYAHLKASRWSVAEGLSYFMMMDKKMKEPSLLIGELNYWQCVKRQGRWEEVKDMAETADYSAKGFRFQLGHLALLDKKKNFFALVPVALTGKDITLDELREFPILADMRKDRRFAQYKASVRKRIARKRKPATKLPKKTLKKKAPTKASRRRPKGRA